MLKVDVEKSRGGMHACAKVGPRNQIAKADTINGGRGEGMMHDKNTMYYYRK